MAPVPSTEGDSRRAKWSSTSASGKTLINWMMQLHLFLLFALFNIAASQSTVKTLPGFPGTLPFKLETGYVSVRESDDVHLFYYFIESDKSPEKDPLLLWLSGGPGCSAFTGLIYEIGPIMFDIPAFNGGLPSLLLNEYSWTKVANIIFLDAPPGAGFSYATTSEGYNSSDTKSGIDIYSFLRKWLMDHPRFIKNPLYIGGDSYGGKFVPMVALYISNDNEAGRMPHISLKGYLLGNGATDFRIEQNSVIVFAHRMGLISDEYFELAKSSCKGEFASPPRNNTVCIKCLQLIEEVTSKIKKSQILEPLCFVDKLKLDPSKLDQDFFDDVSTEILLPSQREEAWCRDRNHMLSYVWANDPKVQEALHVRNGTVKYWKRCNRDISFAMNMPSVFEHHQLLSEKGYRALVYSGDHDMLVTYVGTVRWVRRLNQTIVYSWRPWFVDDQVAGYTEKYKNKGYRLTLATVKGAGHTAPEYKPKECFAMVDRWFSDNAL